MLLGIAADQARRALRLDIARVSQQALTHAFVGAVGVFSILNRNSVDHTEGVLSARLFTDTHLGEVSGHPRTHVRTADPLIGHHAL